MISSEITMTGFNIINANSQSNLIYMSECEDVNLNSWQVHDILAAEDFIVISKSNIENFNDIAVSNSSSTVISIMDSNIGKVESLQISNAPLGLKTTESHISEVTNSTFNSCGSNNNYFGGAVSIINSSVKLRN
jgi:hypothetical protein